MEFSDYSLYLTQNGASKHTTNGHWVTENLGDHHTNTTWQYWNEDNQGIGIKLQKTDNDLVTSYLLGQYKNSLNSNTNYAGAQYQYRVGDSNAHFDIGALIGLATGYKDPLTPMILPTATFGNSNMDFNIRYAPELEGQTPEVWMFNVDYKLK